jgi:lipopolysaccharide heptosyltransferase II
MMGGTPRRIAIVRALFLGDLLVAVPALRSIRATFPSAEITLVGLPWAASFTERFSHYINRFEPFPGWPGIIEVPYDPAQTNRFLTEARAYGYDLVIQMHGSGRFINRFVAAMGARATLGYHEPGETAELTTSAPYPAELPEIWRNLNLAAFLGRGHLDPRLEFPLTGADRAEAERLLRPYRVPSRRPLIGIHPGASAPARRWPAERFAQVADYFVERHRAGIILTGGPGEEEAVAKVERRMRHQALNLAGQTSLGGLAAVIDGLDLFLSNDTGPAHVAVARETPSVVVFGPADARRWAPLDQARHRTVWREVACNPCQHRVCPIDHRCLRGIEAGSVINAVERQLQKAEFTCAV